jgi:hypothetical protein
LRCRLSVPRLLLRITGLLLGRITGLLLRVTGLLPVARLLLRIARLLLRITGLLPVTGLPRLLTIAGLTLLPTLRILRRGLFLFAGAHSGENESSSHHTVGQ